MLAAFIEDIRRHIGQNRPLSARSAAKAVLHDFGLQDLAGYRLGRHLMQLGGSIWHWPVLPFAWALYFLWSRYIRIAYDIHLALSAEIAEGLYIGHFGGIHVARCRLGRHCSISHSTQIHPGDSGAGPTLGDRVWVGAHATIVGPFSIGTGSTVSAAAVVQRDIPDHALCMGNPARVVMKGYDNTAILMLG